MFSRADRSAPDTARAAVLHGIQINRQSSFFDSINAHNFPNVLYTKNKVLVGSIFF